eukprot:TRINITY_DN2801_c0_g2_i1.p3 TRINITY_DN2801_c0_g2~~TRINITY_DN2801_c0_g2_i1.p3  ORF type:complete len:182 (-),score=34.94 TRINITY_DN2801_c0_g2_i1:143-688(-)
MQQIAEAQLAEALADRDTRTATRIVRTPGGAAAVSRRGSEALHTAVRLGLDCAVVRAMLDAGAAVAAKDSRGWTPLHHAAACDQHADEADALAVVEELLARGADPRTLNSSAQTAAQLAQHAAVAHLLAERDAELRVAAQTQMRERAGAKRDGQGRTSAASGTSSAGGSKAGGRRRPEACA